MTPRSSSREFRPGDLVVVDAEGRLVSASCYDEGAVVLGRVIAVETREIVVEVHGRDYSRPGQLPIMRFPVAPVPVDLLAWRDTLLDEETRADEMDRCSRACGLAIPGDTARDLVVCLTTTEELET